MNNCPYNLTQEFLPLQGITNNCLISSRNNKDCAYLESWGNNTQKAFMHISCNNTMAINITFNCNCDTIFCYAKTWFLQRNSQMLSLLTPQLLEVCLQGCQAHLLTTAGKNSPTTLPHLRKQKRCLPPMTHIWLRCFGLYQVRKFDHNI